MTDQALGELSFARVFDAPRELVFRCLIDPEHLTHFWGPAGVSAPLAHITVDPRPGGVFETVMVSDADGSQYPTRAVYVEVTEPERLVWTETHSGMTVTATLTDLGGSRTEIRIHQANVPAAFLTPQAQAGFLTSLDRFAGYLAGITHQR
ncbi:MAG TPA: SRPBCC domain-containing protein [Streptosporangiaceae bacterium]